jgi:asparagine synthase (glutamine-hydrolysing)
LQAQSDLKKALFTAVEESTEDNVPVGVAFSGGVDSSLLAKICKEIGLEVMLLTVGFPKSHDIEFSKVVASKMALSHKLYELNDVQFNEDLEFVRKKISCRNVSHIENCVAYLNIARFARQNDLYLVLTANGCDELFCGYNMYRLIYEQGETNLKKLMEQKIANELELVKEVQMTISGICINIKQPFLTQKFITFANRIPIGQKIHGPDDFVRKHILRTIALSLGVPVDSAMKPKKAIQYGSMIHKKFTGVSRFHIL